MSKEINSLMMQLGVDCETAIGEVKTELNKQGYELVLDNSESLNGQDLYFVLSIESGAKHYRWNNSATIEAIWFNEVAI